MIFAGKSYHLFTIVLMRDKVQQGIHLPQILLIKWALLQHPTIPYYIYCGPQVLEKFSSIFPVYLHIFYQFQVMHLSSSVSRKIDLAVDNGLNINIIYTVHSTAWCKYVVLVVMIMIINPLNPELNPICYLLALLAHHFLHISRIRVKSLTLRLLMSYTHGAPILDVSRSHTTTQHSR